MDYFSCQLTDFCDCICTRCPASSGEQRDESQQLAFRLRGGSEGHEVDKCYEDELFDVSLGDEDESEESSDTVESAPEPASEHEIGLSLPGPDEDNGSPELTPVPSLAETVTHLFQTKCSTSVVLPLKPHSPRHEFTTQWIYEQQDALVVGKENCRPQPVVPMDAPAQTSSIQPRTPKLTVLPDTTEPVVDEELHLDPSRTSNKENVSPLPRKPTIPMRLLPDTSEPVTEEDVLYESSKIVSPSVTSTFLDLAPSDPGYLDTSRAILECNIESTLMTRGEGAFRGLSYPIDLHPEGGVERTNALAQHFRFLEECQERELPLERPLGARSRRPRLKRTDSLYTSMLDQRFRHRLRQIARATRPRDRRASISPPRSLERYQEAEEDYFEDEDFMDVDTS